MHKLAFQAAVLDPESGELVEERFAADRESLARWADGWRDRVEAVASEATTGWRWVWRELVARGFEVRLAEPVQARALLGRRRSAKTDRSMRAGSRACWPRRCCRSRGSAGRDPRAARAHAAAQGTRRGAPPLGQRLHACLLHEGGPARGRSCSGRRARAGRRRLRLPAPARLQVDSLLAVIAALEVQLEIVDAELRRFARQDERRQALQSSYGVGPLLACHLLAEIGEARRLRRADESTRLAGLDPVVAESGDARRRGQLAQAGSPHLRWALVEAAVHAHRASAPDLARYRATRKRRDTAVARLTGARKIGKRAFHVLRELEFARA